MCLTCRVPKNEELPDLSSFDLAFLTLTGRVGWEDPFDHAFTLMKTAKAHDSKIILWGPEAELLFKAVERKFEKILLPTVKKIIKCFDLSGDITVDAPRARALNGELRELGNKFADSLQTPARAVIATILENAEEHFTTQRDKTLKQLTEAGWRSYLEEANSSHLDEFLRKFPEDTMHPHIEKMIVLGETSASRRLIDRGILSERIGRLGDTARMSLSEITDVEAGLAWTGTGLGLAAENGVTHYIIQAEEDKRTCQVCLRLNGRKVSVAGAAGVLESVLAGHRRHRFPRVPQIDNVSPEEVEGMNLFPPFHPRCRCDLGFLWRETVPTGRPTSRRAPDVTVPFSEQLTTELTRTIEELKDFAVTSIGTSEEMVAAAELDSGKLITKYKQTLRMGDAGDGGLVVDEAYGVGDDWLMVDGKLRPDRSVLHLHTHPDGSSFSDGDWGAFSWGQVGEMRVYTSSRMEFRLVKTQQFMDVPWQKRTPKAIKEAWNRHLEVVEQNLKNIPGESIDEFVARITHEVNRTMASEFGVEFGVIEAEGVAASTGGFITPELLPPEFSMRSGKYQFKQLADRLLAEGKDDAAKLLETWRPGNGDIAVKEYTDATGARRVKSFAQVYPSKGRPDTYRVIGMEGFGDDWLTSKYDLIKTLAKDAVDIGRTVFQVDATGLDAYTMKKFGFKKSGRYFTAQGDDLVRFTKGPITPRPIPPPPPPPVTAPVAPTAPPLTPTPPTPSGPLLKRTGDWTAEERKFRRDRLEYYVRDIDFSLVSSGVTKKRLLDTMEEALDHWETVDLERLANFKLKFKIKGSGKEGVFKPHPADGTAMIKVGATLSRKTIAHEFGHAYDWYNANRVKFLRWVKPSNSATKFGRLTEDDADIFRAWYKKYTENAPLTKGAGGWETRAAQWVDDYEGRLYSGWEGVEWWSVNSARYSHYVQEARKIEKEIVEIVNKYGAKGITEAEVNKLPDNIRKWVLGDSHLEGIVADATRYTKWQKGVDMYGEEVTNLIRKAYNYKPLDYFSIRRPTIIKPPPSPVVPITGKVPHPVPKTFRDMVLNEHRDQVLHYSARHNLTVDEAIQRLSDHINTLAKNSDTWVRRKSRLLSILEDGRFKTQFETNTSSGLLNRNRRASWEHQVGGYSKTLPPKDRIVYGYISDDPDGMLNHRMNVDQYGSIAFKLKRQVRERTTFLLGDSLGNHSASWDKIDEGSHYAIDHGFIREFFKDGPRKKLNLRWKDDVHGKVEEVDTRYWEAQYHYGLSVDDIEEVVLPIGSGFGGTESEVRRHFKKAIEILEKKNIPYRFVDRTNARWGGTY